MLRLPRIGRRQRGCEAERVQRRVQHVARRLAPPRRQVQRCSSTMQVSCSSTDRSQQQCRHARFCMCNSRLDAELDLAPGRQERMFCAPVLQMAQGMVQPFPYRVAGPQEESRSVTCAGVLQRRGHAVAAPGAVAGCMIQVATRDDAAHVACIVRDGQVAQAQLREHRVRARRGRLRPAGLGCMCQGFFLCGFLGVYGDMGMKCAPRGRHSCHCMRSGGAQRGFGVRSKRHP